MAWLCDNCGHEADLTRTDPENGVWRCPHCGAEARMDSTEVQPPADEPADTVFQPALMMESIMDELEGGTSEPTIDAANEPGTETLETDPSTLPSPYLQLDVEAYLLILGASPGQERRPLVRAKTTFGRRHADVVLEDPAVSSQHFQIEAFGKEFFVRDLDSRNGTLLNGTKIRYSQLLAGDQITAGKTTMTFRTSDDLIDRE